MRRLKFPTKFSTKFPGNCYNTPMPEALTIGFLGAGKMATALARGFINAGLVTPEKVLAGDVAEAARQSFAKETGAKAVAGNGAVTEFAKVLVLAVKPSQAEELLAEIQPQFTTGHLLISIAAGLPLARLERRLPEKARVVRVMPNTPALVGASATGFALGKAANAEDAQLVLKLFSAVGVAFELKEELLDAVTGLSGSGPAYVYIAIEALSDGGVAAGLPREIATRLAAQTVLGAARMVLETGQHPGALKDMVASPGGTTIEGIRKLEKGNFRATLINAVLAAARKARQLGRPGGKD
jgi:pyrroline-5-carboxylate reductase